MIKDCALLSHAGLIPLPTSKEFTPLQLPPHARGRMQKSELAILSWFISHTHPTLFLSWIALVRISCWGSCKRACFTGCLRCLICCCWLQGFCGCSTLSARCTNYRCVWEIRQRGVSCNAGSLPAVCWSLGFSLRAANLKARARSFSCLPPAPALMLLRSWPTLVYHGLLMLSLSLLLWFNVAGKMTIPVKRLGRI